MLFIKLLRDIRRNLGSAITIIMITSIGIMFWTGFEGISTNMNNIVEEYYDYCAMPDIFVSGKNFTYNDIRDIKKLHGVYEAIGRTVTDFYAPDFGDDAQLRVYAQEPPPSLNIPYLMEGSVDRVGARDILLDYDFAIANDIVVGDRLRLRLGNNYYNYNVSALVKTPENIFQVKDVSEVFPNPKEFGFAMLDAKAVSDILYKGERHVYNQIVIKADSAVINDIKDYLSYHLGSRAISIIDRAGHFSASMINQEAEGISSVTGVFPSVFFIIAALISYTSIKRMVDKERTIIGTMKALGISNFKIILHYSGYGVIFGVAASVIGLTLGTVIPEYMFKLYEIYFSFPPYRLTLDFNTGVTAAATGIVFCTGAAFLASRKTLTLPPSVCMRPKTSKAGKRIFIENITILWKRLSDLRKIVFRNMFRSKDRLIMCVFGISCSCALTFIAVGMQTSIDFLMHSMYSDLNNYDIRVFMHPEAIFDEKQRIIRHNSAVAGELIMDTSGKVLDADGVQKTVSITVTPEIVTQIGIYEGRDRALPLPDSGCIISDFLAGSLGVYAGDEIDISFQGKRDVITVPISMVIPSSFGQGIYISENMWRRAGEAFIPTSALITLDKYADPQLVKKEIMDYDFVSGVKLQSELQGEMQKNMEASTAAVYIMILFAGLISFIILFNLGILNYYEREREIATLKVIGFKNREVKKMAFGENYIFSGIGTILGCALGNWGLNLMLDMSANEFYSISKHIGIGNFIMSAALIFMFAGLTNLYLGRYTKGTNMIASLKMME